MPTGRVRWFDAAKGYGFITSEEGKDVFLPAQALPTGVNTLRKGAKVEYSVVDVAIATLPPPKARSWPRCCVPWRINSTCRTDATHD